MTNPATSTEPAPAPAPGPTPSPVAPRRPGSSGARRTYLVVCILLVVAVVVQFYFAAFGVFTAPENDSQFILHSINGMFVIPLLSIVATVTAAIAKAPGRTIALSILPLLLIVVQYLLFFLAGAFGGDENSTTIGARIVLGLHAVNGVAILATAVVLAHRARRLVRGASAVEAVPPAA